ncbi:MAG: transcription termination factor NusA [bacterium]|nr:transcription termination factor NusA [bacterium]
MKQEKSEVIEAIKALAKEKDIDENRLFATIENAMKAAYRKNLPKGAVEPTNVVVNVSRDTGVATVLARMLVVEEVVNPASQITLEDAKKHRASAQMGDIVEIDVTPRSFLRVAAQTAKQVIMQSIREAERGKVYDEYSEKKDEILTAVVKRIEPGSILVDLGHTEGVLDVHDLIPGEVLHEDDHIKVYVMDVQRAATAAHGPQVRVSRVHPNLVRRLFEMEVPEIAGGSVVIKSLAREAGSRTKMAVCSDNPMIDPVGACVGQRGNRVDRVVEELRGEKIDIIKWSDDPVEFVANALNPAHVVSVYTADNLKSCRVVVPDNQLSLAIGKEGQNARLAAKLTGWKIDIKSESQAAEMTDMIDEVVRNPAHDLPELPDFELPDIELPDSVLDFGDLSLPGDDDTL